ncbi:MULTISPECIES: endonuclease/exonuclease/phosphatase family protein [unclassified Streptomyces]|uniref:endonuclease/exonuclease/phosphatase family protein n=1 Tax=unclassified Streptomyces TaxID=2593676 RepID=UPI000CD54D1A|nr:MULTISPECIES: endonuclease/exonuclease/phosphatase family protein [unclassified Streptomyces]
MARTETSAGTPAPGADDPEPAESRTPKWSDSTGRWRRGLILAGIALTAAAAMLLHSKVPNAIGNFGSLLQTFLPWLGLVIPVVVGCALLRRSVSALAAVLVTALVWLNLFGGLLVDKTGDGGSLMVVSHNVDAENSDPEATARNLAGSGADLLALQEIPEGQEEVYDGQLAQEFPYHSVQGTVGLWSRYPMSRTQDIDIGMGWPRAMRSTVATPQGEVAAYVAHLPSVRVEFRSGFTAGKRDRAADTLAEAIAADSQDRVVLLGDLNGTMNDRALAPLTSQLRSTQGAAGAGFGFSFPAGFPVTRIDQILVRGLEPVSSWTLPATGSDHLPVAARLDL